MSTIAPMTAIPGIDAAWTFHNPSGVALVSNTTGRWHCVAVAPNYDTFVAIAAGHAVDWNAPVTVSAGAAAKALLDAACRIRDGGEGDVITVDMYDPPRVRPPRSGGLRWIRSR